MKNLLLFLAFCWLFASNIKAQNVVEDWLITPMTQRSEIKTLDNGKVLELNNGLVARRIQISPNAATTSFKNSVSNEQFIRSVRPEARIVLNGKTYNIGGLYGQKEYAYLLESWISDFTSNDADFQYIRHEITDVQPHLSSGQ